MYLIFDIETTSLNPMTGDVIQFAYLKLDDSLKFINSEVLYFYKEGMHWSDEAFAIHGIPKEFLKQYENDYETNLKKMYTVFTNCNAVTFNGIAFDSPFCQHFLKKNGLPVVTPNQEFDVMVALRREFHKNVKLASLPERLQIPDTVVESFANKWFGYSAGSHDAAYDTTVTALGFLYCMNKGYFKPIQSVPYGTNTEEDKSIWDDTPINLAFYKVRIQDEVYVMNPAVKITSYLHYCIPVTVLDDVINRKLYKGVTVPDNVITALQKVKSTEVIFEEVDSNRWEYEMTPNLIGVLEKDTESVTFKCVKR